MKEIKELISVAPMMDLTDRHFRYLLRLISKHVVLYTEMITAKAIIHGDTARLLKYDDIEHPIVLQLGGSSPQELATSAKIAADFGYDAINLNVGCPSDRVQSGQFGACLMAKPELIADCIAMMSQASALPVSVKTRIGIDHLDSYPFLLDFIDTVATAGCQRFIIHARKAWLTGLNPKENRTIPPLDYARVYQLKQDRPHLDIIINGGITTINEIERHLQSVDGVMLGRSIYTHPMLLAQIEHAFFASTATPPIPQAVLQHYLPYLRKQTNAGIALSSITRHLVNLFHGQQHARKWRRFLSEKIHTTNDPDILLDFV
jgi:tRNA-dihydrouridine synthase A